MAIVQISKIQHRYGAIIDLPQLDEAELGWATDAKRLFIGKISPNENVEVLTSYSQIDLSQIYGSSGASLNLQDLVDGQVISYNAATDSFINNGGNALDSGNSSYFTTGNIHLGSVDNVKIGGGAIGYVLETDGSGNLSWSAKGTLITDILAISNATPMVMTVDSTTPYTNALKVTISGVQGTNANTVVNGQSFYIKLSVDYPTSGNVSLYTDQTLTSAAAGTGLVATADTGKATSSLFGGSAGSITAQGSNGSVQFNDTNVLQGDSAFTFNNTGTKTLTVNGNIITGNLSANSGIVKSNVVIANAIGVGTNTPLYGLHLTANSQYIESGLGANSSTIYTGHNRLIFDNTHNDIARGPEKITVYDNGTGWLAGLGVHSNTAAYYSGGNSTFYYAVSGTYTSVLNITNTGISANNITATGNANITGNVNVTSGVLSGNGSSLTNLNASNLSTGTVPIDRLFGTYNIGISGAASTAGTVTTAAQPNITSVSTSFTGLTLAANGNITLSGTGSSVSGANLVSATYLTGTLTTAAQTNITSLGTLSSLTIASDGTITLSGAGSQLSGANLVSATYLTGTLTTAAQPNVTSLGTLSSLVVSGNITANNATITTLANVGTLLTRAITTGTNGTTGTIEGDWSLSVGSKLQATYADLAENYTADRTYEAGTVLAFGGDYEVTLAEDGTNRVAGVVTTNPAYVMNSQCPGDFVASIALQGRVPTKVRGTIKKGDMLISAGDGFARASNYPSIGTVIGKALENFDGYEGVIEVAVGRV